MTSWTIYCPKSKVKEQIKDDLLFRFFIHITKKGEGVYVTISKEIHSLGTL